MISLIFRSQSNISKMIDLYEDMMMRFDAIYETKEEALEGFKHIGLDWADASHIVLKMDA